MPHSGLCIFHYSLCTCQMGMTVERLIQTIFNVEISNKIDNTCFLSSLLTSSIFNFLKFNLLIQCSALVLIGYLQLDLIQLMSLAEMSTWELHYHFSKFVQPISQFVFSFQINTVEYPSFSFKLIFYQQLNCSRLVWNKNIFLENEYIYILSVYFSSLLRFKLMFLFLAFKRLLESKREINHKIFRVFDK